MFFSFSLSSTELRFHIEHFVRCHNTIAQFTWKRCIDKETHPSAEGIPSGWVGVRWVRGARCSILISGFSILKHFHCSISGYARLFSVAQLITWQANLCHKVDDFGKKSHLNATPRVSSSSSDNFQNNTQCAQQQQWQQQPQKRRVNENHAAGSTRTSDTQFSPERTKNNSWCALSNAYKNNSRKEENHIKWNRNGGGKKTANVGIKEEENSTTHR